jgi:hypothetical protein
MTPQQLIDLPNYGAAQRAVKAMGKWNATRILEEGKEYVFTVKVSGTYFPEIETQTVTVTASSKDDAMDAAEDLADFDEIEDVEIVDVEATDE